MLDEHGTVTEHKADNFELAADPLEVAQDNAADSSADLVADQNCPDDTSSTSPDRMQVVRDWAVYRYYFKSAGLPLSLSFLGVSLLVAFCYNFPSMLLTPLVQIFVLTPSPQHFGSNGGRMPMRYPQTINWGSI